MRIIRPIPTPTAKNMDDEEQDSYACMRLVDHDEMIEMFISALYELTQTCHHVKIFKYMFTYRRK